MDVDLIVNHHYHISLISTHIPLRGYSFIKSGVAEVQLSDNRTYHLPSEMYELMKKEAEEIYSQYKDDDFYCFWSIPNKWFEEMELIKFITEFISPSLSLNWPRQDWYWP